MYSSSSFTLKRKQKPDGSQQMEEDKQEDDSDSEAEELAMVLGTRGYKCCVNPLLKMTEEELTAGFARFDIDNSGKIDRDEVKCLMVELYGDDLGERLTIKAMKHDKDHDGELSYDEFKSFVASKAAERRLTLTEMIFITFDNPNASKTAKVISVVIISLIAISSTTFVLETVSMSFSPNLPSSEHGINTTAGPRIYIHTRQLHG